MFVLHILASCFIVQNVTKYLSQDPNYVDVTAYHKHAACFGIRRHLQANIVQLSYFICSSRYVPKFGLLVQNKFKKPTRIAFSCGVSHVIYHLT